MRVYGGAEPTHGYNVQVSRAEVAAFARRWPGCRLPDAVITFCFDARGNLADILPERIAHKVDGPEAVALSEDAQAYARRALGRD